MYGWSTHVPHHHTQVQFPALDPDSSSPLLQTVGGTGEIKTQTEFPVSLPQPPHLPAVVGIWGVTDSLILSSFTPFIPISLKK